MSRTEKPTALAQLEEAHNLCDQAVALRLLKNEIVGHKQNKEKYVRLGALHTVVHILRKAKPQDSSRSRSHAMPNPEDVEVPVQALQVLSSFSKGGPRFLTPLQASDAVPAALSRIAPRSNHPRIVIAALRLLVNCVTISAGVSRGHERDELLNTLFRHPSVGVFYDILTQTDHTRLAREQKQLAVRLISRLAEAEERFREDWTEKGVLDALSTLVASFVIARGEVVPGAEYVCEELVHLWPEPAPRAFRFGEVLEAVCAVIEDSPYRAGVFLYSPAILAVFPSLPTLPLASQPRAVWRTLGLTGLGGVRSRNSGAMDQLLPHVLAPIRQTKPSHGFDVRRATSKDHSPVLKKRIRWESAVDDMQALHWNDSADAESPVVPWLIHLIRSGSSTVEERLHASAMLASLSMSGFASPEREATICAVVVPILCELMRTNSRDEPPEESVWEYTKPEIALRWSILERVPAILARLVAESPSLQQAACNCNALPRACKLLMTSYEPLPSQPPPRPWSPNPASALGQLDYDDQTEGLANFRLGPTALLPAYLHRVKSRESSLKLIAALASSQEESRKRVVEQGALPYVITSLSEWPENPQSLKDKPKVDKGASENAAEAEKSSPYGHNPISVISAACHCVRVLARSVRVLRTALEDYGAATYIFDLLKNGEESVQSAACGAMCNLVNDVGTMRAALIREGVLDVLCEQAHSADPGLRLNAMWALKHLVHTVNNNSKKRALEHLTPDWLVQLIDFNTEDEALHARTSRRHGRGGENGASSYDASNEDEDESMDDERNSEDDDWESPAMSRLRAERPELLRFGPPKYLQDAQKELATLWEAEQNPVRRARNDDLAIQEQGLNFIRNLIGPSCPTSPTSNAVQDLSEMVDYVLGEIGQEQFFDILSGKLRPRVLHPFARRQSSSCGANESRMLYPQARIVEAVVGILVHVAASVPKHRQLVISQTQLLKHLISHFSDKDASVRRALCHLLTNLVWQEDSSDVQACRQRSMELQRMGFLSKLEALEQGDKDTDIRERARGAVWQLRSATSS